MRGRNLLVCPLLCLFLISESNCAIICALRVVLFLCTSPFLESHMSHDTFHNLRINSVTHHEGLFLLPICSRYRSCTPSHSVPMNPSTNEFSPICRCWLLALRTPSPQSSSWNTCSSSRYASRCAIIAIRIGWDVLCFNQLSKFRSVFLYAIVARLL